MVPGRIEIPNPLKMLQDAVSNLQNRLNPSRDIQTKSVKPHINKLSSEGGEQVASTTLEATSALPADLKAASGPSGWQVPAGPITKDDLGRATWTLLHTLAAQYPQNPTRRQQKDVQTLVRAAGSLCSYLH